MKVENQYSFLDKTIHHLASLTRTAQLVAAAMEDTVFARQMRLHNCENPVFLTALPRSGTTLLLELLENIGEFASHTYRDMPFILTPLLWSKVSGAFKQAGMSRERAHGDGMMVSVDSPEAFEEVLWATFWKKQYQEHHIEPWNPRLKFAEFEHFFRQHMKKIILLHAGQERGARYISKNNMNIARLSYLSKTFPKADIIVLYRHPIQHASSLWKQHKNFLQIHSDNAFAQKYMLSIGHYDFGENLKPIDFSAWRSQHPNLSPTGLEFWLRYWIVCYQSMLQTPIVNVSLFSYEAFCRRPKASLEVIADRVKLQKRSAFIEQADRIAPRKPHAPDISGISSDLVDEATELYRALDAKAINTAY